MKQDILKNQTINSTLTFFAPSFQMVDPEPDGGPFAFKLKETFRMMEPCKNLGNGRVRLTYYNPDAKSVSVIGSEARAFTGEHPMTKGEDGYWTVEVEVTPGIHVHRYLVDGALVLHDQMPLVYCAGEPANAFECVDEDCGWYLLQDVPHGDLRMEYYRSSHTGRWRVCWVYCPAGYDAKPDKKYPVLYLQHGAGEDEVGWIDMGKMNYILDNQIASGETEEMLVVMSYGFSLNEDETPALRSPGFEEELLNDVIPMIEEKYRAKTDRESRAMAGLSMGSAQSQSIVLNHLDLFAYLGVIIGGIGTAPIGVQAEALKDPKALGEKLKVFYASNGDHEAGCMASHEAMEKMVAEGLTCGRHDIFEGYHDLDVCRKSLRAFLPLLFN